MMHIIKCQNDKFFMHQYFEVITVCLGGTYLSCCEWYTEYTLNEKKKVDTFSTFIISYTNSIDGKFHISYEREIPPL